MAASTKHFTRRLLPVALVILAIMTGAMIVLRVSHNPAYLWVAMISPLAGVAASALHAWSYLGGRRAIVFMVVTGLGSLILETFGVATGWLYGPYHYTYRLGPLFMGLTPYLIPVTWFMMLYPSYVMSRIITRRLMVKHAILNTLVIASIGGLIMTSWDLVLDPVMVKQEHWVWEVFGGYFGIPIQNFLGWWFTSFTILIIFEWFDSRNLTDKDIIQADLGKKAILIYLIIGAGNIAGAAVTGLWGPAVIALVAMGIWTILAWGSIK